MFFHRFQIIVYLSGWPYQNYRYADRLTSEMAIFACKMINVLKQMKNQIPDFELWSKLLEYFDRNNKKNVVPEEAQYSKQIYVCFNKHLCNY